MYRVSFVFIATLMWALLSSAPLQAQEGTYCDGLAAAECTLLSGSLDAMSDISSGATGLTMEMLLQDIPEMPTNELYFRYDQSLGFMLGEEMAALIQSLMGMSPDELESLGDDPATILDIGRVMVNDMNMGVDMDLEMSEGMAALLSEEMRDDIGMDLPTELGLRIMIVDGIFYVDTTSIAPFAPEITAFVDGWVGVDANPLLDMAAAELGADSMAGEADAASMATGSIGMTGALVATVDAFDPSGEIVKFLDVEVLEVESAGEDEAYFRTTVDYDSFFQSPVFRQLVGMFAADQGAEMSAEEMDEMMTIAQIMGPSLLQGLELQMVELIQKSTGHVNGGDLLLEWDLASLLLLASQGDPSMQIPPDAEPFVGLNIVTSAEDLNQEVDLSAPESAFVVPTEMLMSFMQ